MLSDWAREIRKALVLVVELQSAQLHIRAHSSPKQAAIIRLRVCRHPLKCRDTTSSALRPRVAQPASLPKRVLPWTLGQFSGRLVDFVGRWAPITLFIVVQPKKYMICSEALLLLNSLGLQSVSSHWLEHNC